MDPALICKVFFTLGTAVDLAGPLIPSFRRQIMNYGSRGIDISHPEPKSTKNQLRNLFDQIASFQVPHTWFTHYYILSVASSLFWGFQILTNGRILQFLASCSSEHHSAMTLSQVYIAWFMMAFQGLRRLYESLSLTKPSQSKMWAGLWILGLAFYAVMGVSVWIEGIGECIRALERIII